MKNKLQILCLILLGTLVSIQAHAQTADFLDQIVVTAYFKDDIAELDKIAAKLRKEKSRTPSGNWHLDWFYVLIHRSMYEGGKVNSPAQWAKVESRINRWVASSPQSVVAPIALAHAQRWHAWDLRGHGFASTVTEEGWRDFAKQMAIAEHTLQSNKKISSVDPQWYVEALDVSLALGRPISEYMALYEEGVTKEPLYYDTYIQAIERLLPMWGGNLEMIKAFADDAVKRTAALDGQILYARIYLHVRRRVGRDTFELLRGTVGPKTKAGFEDLIKKYPSNWNKNLYARFACQIGEMNAFARLAKEIEDKPDPQAWPVGEYKECTDSVKFPLIK